MKRLLALSAGVVFLCAAVLIGGTASAQTKTLRIVAHADVKILDPTFTTAYISRNFGYMVYDTLFAQDAKRPAEAADGRQVHRPRRTASSGRFTLRPGPQVLATASAVTAADCVASLQRWSSARLHRPRHDGAPAPSGRRSTRAPSR